MDIEEAENRLFQLKESMELLDLVTGNSIKENTKLNITAIETVLNTMYKAIEESAYYRDLVKLERKETEKLKKSLKGQIKKKDLIINEMAKEIYEDDNIFGFGVFKDINTPEKIKEYFTKKVEGK